MGEQADKPLRDFVVEGMIEVGPRHSYFAFVDGEFFGGLLCQNAGVRPKENEYTKLGRARITVEWLLDEETEEASSS